MSKLQLVERLFAAAMYFANPEKQPEFPGHEETVEETTERYRAIADDIASVVTEMKGTRKEADLLLAWAIGESYLARDADVGPCFRAKHNGGDYRKRCDGGLAASMWQIHKHVARDGTEVSTEMLFADRKLAARTMLRQIRASSKACKHLKEPADRLSQAGLGRCVEGNKSVRARFALWVKIAGWKPAPKKEEKPAPKASGSFASVRRVAGG